jgi:hypothetical protein
MQLNHRLRDDIFSIIETIRGNAKLYQEKSFIIRAQTMDDLEFKIIDRIDALNEDRDILDKMTDLKKIAQKTKHNLEEVDLNMFLRLRMKISQGEYRGERLLQLIAEYLDDNLKGFPHQDATGYDDLDTFLNGLLTYEPIPSETKGREPEMVYYQKTPARIMLELIKRAEFKPQDVFIDLGSGLGQAAMLVNLITAVPSIGVEFEPLFCAYARARAAELHLQDVEFISGDARFADYSRGTVFYMYTPFEGKMLQETLQNLMGEAKKSKIRIFTYGPCSPIVAQQNWLMRVNERHHESGGLVEFQSL